MTEVSEHTVSKACTQCCRLLPATPEFYVRCSARAHKDGLFTRCKMCRNAVVNEGNRRRRQRLIDKAGRVAGACDVCGRDMTCGKRGAAYDHNHATGEFRGWLCGGCNLALGNAGDNPEILDRLAAYLREHGYAVTRTLPEAVK